MSETTIAQRVPQPARWLAVAGFAATILVASIVDPGGGIARPGPLGLLTVASWSHLGAYAILTLGVLWALDGSSDIPTRISAVGTVMVVGYSALIELLQSPLPYRTCAIGDLLANSVGALVALSGWVVLQRSERR